MTKICPLGIGKSRGILGPILYLDFMTVRAEDGSPVMLALHFGLGILSVLHSSGTLWHNETVFYSLPGRSGVLERLRPAISPT